MVKVMKSDAEIRRDVEAELEWEPSVDARRIGVAVDNGVVTLTGEVGSYAQKWKAERAVERVEGVRAIVNEIEVKLPGEFSDADLAKSAVDALRWNILVPDDSITVKVDNGWITLKGEVTYDYQRRAAERALRNLPGVKGISNLITIKPKVEPKNIKGEIEKSLTRLALTDANNVDVEVNGREVILRGTVRSLAEKFEAEKAAWSAPGVSSVKNLIEVAPAAA
jgi:osmotically-inducible protein OsmY